jgi:hypothetical protein
MALLLGKTALCNPRWVTNNNAACEGEKEIQYRNIQTKATFIMRLAFVSDVYIVEAADVKQAESQPHNVN